MYDFFNKPIFITGTPRSGTSIIAGILSLHNIWCGETQLADKHNAKGYFENLQLRNMIIKPIIHQMGGDVLGVRSLPPLENAQPIPNLSSIINNIIKKQGYQSNMYWLLKEPKLALVWPSFNVAFPNATWVIVKREQKDIVRSCLNTSFMKQHSLDSKYWNNFVDQYNDRLDQLMRSVNTCIEIWPNNIVNKDYSKLSLITSRLGIHLDEDTVSEFIHNDYWNSINKYET